MIKSAREDRNNSDASLQGLLDMCRTYVGLAGPVEVTEEAASGILDAAVRHGLVPILLSKVFPLHRLSNRQAFAARALGAFYAEYLPMLAGAARELSADLDDAGIPHCVRKGPTLAKFYLEPSHRSFTDIDFLVEREYSAQVRALLQKRGYSQGNFNYRTGTVLPLSKEVLVQYRLNPDHLPHHSLVSKCCGIPVGVDMDFAFQVGWSGDGVFASTAELLSRAAVVSGLRGLEDVDLAADVLLHAYRELYLYGLAVRQQPTLRMLLDCFLVLRHPVLGVDIDRLVDRMPGIEYVLHALGELLDDIFDGNVDAVSRRRASYVYKGGKKVFIQSTILQRLNATTHESYVAMLDCEVSGDDAG